MGRVNVGESKEGGKEAVEECQLNVGDDRARIHSYRMEWADQDGSRAIWISNKNLGTIKRFFNIPEDPDKS